ncbi:sulfite exporter TauE/SafE family protein [Granulosicoccaceae sp. 1_MG-2023]|nr:sulfite exporter TauE/SafE family protein [Granulosicoccaceae sp. 1_MG-2023]
MLDWLILIVAGFAAGVLNAIAGGGSFLTLPALVFTGVAPVVANATSAMAVFPGYASSALGFRDELQQLPAAQLRQYVVLTLLGGAAGAGLLLITSNAAFMKLIPWLLLLATLLFAFGGRIQSALRERGAAHQIPSTPLLLLVSVYGGYFNGGLGILLLAAFNSLGMRDLHLMNGLKNILSFVLAAISVLIFVLAGLIAWPQAIVMMLAASAGGYAGAVWSKRLPAAGVKAFITFTGLLMTLVFYLRYY